MGDSNSDTPLLAEEDFACDVQRAEDESEEKLQNALEDHEDFLRHAFQKAAGTVCRLASAGRDEDVPVILFQEAATAVTRLYKVALLSHRSCAEYARRCGHCQRSREVYDACRKVRAGKQLLRRDEVLAIAAQRPAACHSHACAGTRSSACVASACTSTCGGACASPGTSSASARPLSPTMSKDYDEVKRASLAADASFLLTPEQRSGSAGAQTPACRVASYQLRQTWRSSGISEDVFDSLSITPHKRHHPDNEDGCTPKRSRV